MVAPNGGMIPPSNQDPSRAIPSTTAFLGMKPSEIYQQAGIVPVVIRIRPAPRVPVPGTPAIPGPYFPQVIPEPYFRADPLTPLDPTMPYDPMGPPLHWGGRILRF